MNKRSFKHKIKHAALFVFLSLALAGAGFNSASAINISQESLEVTDKSATTVVHDAGIGDLIITPNLEFNRLNDFISYKLVIKNNDGKKYQIVGITDDNTNEAIDLTYSYSTGMDTNNKEIIFTIKYIQTSDSPLETITVIVKIVDEDEDSADVPIVIPDTGNNTSSGAMSAVVVGAAAVYVAFAILCLVIYIIARRKGMNSHKVLLTLVLLIGMVPAVAIAASSGEIQFIVDLTDVKLNGPYVVTFDTDGGEGDIPPQTVNNGDTVVRPSLTPVKEGYNFDGWADEAGNLYDFDSPVTGPVTLKAKWTIKEYTVTFNSDGGAPTPDSQVVKYKEFATKPSEDPTKEHYVFSKWVDENGNEFDFSTSITSDITLTAKWIPAVAMITPVEADSDNNINLKMKQISNPGETITKGYDFKDTVVTAFVRATDEDYEAMGSSLTSDNIVSDSSSLAPVYMWFDDTTGAMYWYTEAAKVKFTGTMGRLFAKFDALTDIDSFADFDTSDVTDMNRIFQNCRSLQDTIDPETGEVTKAVLAPIANWDVSSVKSFVFAFGSGADGDAPMISDFSPISGWNVGACEDFSQMFKYNRYMKNLNAFENWNMTSATSIKNMFTGTVALENAAAIKNWNVVNVTTAGFGNVFSSSGVLPSYDDAAKLPPFEKRPGYWTNKGAYIPNS